MISVADDGGQEILHAEALVLSPCFDVNGGMLAFTFLRPALLLATVLLPRMAFGIERPVDVRHLKLLTRHLECI